MSFWTRRIRTRNFTLYIMCNLFIRSNNKFAFFLSGQNKILVWELKKQCKKVVFIRKINLQLLENEQTHFCKENFSLVVSRLDFWSHEQDLNPKHKLLYHFYLSGMLPSPIIMGAIIDKTCTLWQMECGEQSNCILYDLDLMRKYVMSFTASIMIIGTVYILGQ